jgi:hypothetical protein
VLAGEPQICAERGDLAELERVRGSRCQDGDLQALPPAAVGLRLPEVPGSRGTAATMSVPTAAASPSMPWSDLAYSLLPNGRTLDYTIAGLHSDLAVGILKQSLSDFLLLFGGRSGYFPPPGADRASTR